MMEDTHVNKKELIKSVPVVTSIILGAFSAGFLIVVLTVFGELVPPLKNFLKEQHYHHWVGKGVWAAILFLGVSVFSYFVLRKKRSSEIIRVSLIVLNTVLILGTLALFAFFVYEYVIRH